MEQSAPKKNIVFFSYKFSADALPLWEVRKLNINLHNPQKTIFIEILQTHLLWVSIIDGFAKVEHTGPDFFSSWYNLSWRQQKSKGSSISKLNSVSGPDSIIVIPIACRSSCNVQLNRSLRSVEFSRFSFNFIGNSVTDNLQGGFIWTSRTSPTIRTKN
jgi:hypothetical protein